MPMLKTTAISNKRILIVEDDEILCQFLQKSLTKRDYWVDILHNGEAMPKLLERHSIHLLVLDIILPNKDGIYWLKWIQQYYPNIPVIITSVKDKPAERLEGLQAGARDYLIKPFHSAELLIKIKQILGNALEESPQTILKIGEMTFNIEDHCLYKDGAEIRLTKIESKLLQVFCHNAGIPLSRDEIMEQSMGQQYFPSTRRIDTHINRLRNKIEDIPSKPVYIRTVRGRGYCLHIPHDLSSNESTNQSPNKPLNEDE